MASRIRIVGTSGSGKSVLADRVSAHTGLPRLELDAVFWDEGWRMRDLDQARDRVRAFVRDHPQGWVADGNWTSRLGDILDPGTPGGADTVVWLDLPRRRVMRQVVGRTLRRVVRREELWHGNRERAANLLRWHPEKNIVRWAWTNHHVVREGMLERIAAGERIVRLRDRSEIDRWVASLPPRRA
ncbi:toxin [Microbacterium sp. cf332]|uniref:toxin n=1 Tax=Microbacterium sp. cf332 TaxID=1761804 RepID=UPI000881E034|nr:toxin [Microbacterium sp. cf332]SDQ26864.1 Adenylate kinase [Microbacterium sp. cf332]